MDKAEKSPVDPLIKGRIQELIAVKGGGYNADLVEEIIVNALKLLTDVKDRGDVRVIRTALGELRYAFAHGRFETVIGFSMTGVEPDVVARQELESPAVIC